MAYTEERAIERACVQCPSSLVEGKESPAERELSCRDETKKTDRTIRVFPAIPSTIKNVASFRKNFNRHLVYLLFDLNQPSVRSRGTTTTTEIIPVVTLDLYSHTSTYFLYKMIQFNTSIDPMNREANRRCLQHLILSLFGCLPVAARECNTFLFVAQFCCDDGDDDDGDDHSARFSRVEICRHSACYDPSNLIRSQGYLVRFVAGH